MRPQSVTADTTAVLGPNPSNPIIMDIMSGLFNSTVACRPLNGTPTYKLQYTYDDPFAAGGIVNWVDSAVIVAIANTPKDQAIANPIRAVRVNITASNGAVLLTVVQSGPAV